MRITTLTTTLAVALLGTIALAQTVTHDFDRAANFSSYRSYAWVRGTNLDDPLNHNRIVRAVDSQMASKGLANVDANANPDLLVAYQGPRRQCQAREARQEHQPGGGEAVQALPSHEVRFESHGVKPFRPAFDGTLARANPSRRTRAISAVQRPFISLDLPQTGA